MIGWTLWTGWVAGVARRRVRSLLLIALAAGLAGGFAMLAVVAAQRADTSWDRLRAATRAQDLLVSVGTADEAATVASGLADMSDVESIGALAAGGAFTTTPSGEMFAGQILLGLDDRFGAEIYRPVVVDGRRPRAADEVLVNRSFLDRSGFSVGDEFRMAIADGPEDQTGAADTVTIVGEQRGPVDETFTAGAPLIVADPGVWRRWGDTITADGSASFAVMVRLADGVDPDQFASREEVTAILGDASEVITATTQKAVVDDAIRVQAGAFLLIGVVAVVVAAAGVSLLVAREVRVLLAEQQTVRALGADRRSTSVAATVPFVGVGIVAALLAVGVAVVASGWVPIGLPRRLEPAPGPWVDPWVLAIGAVVVALVCALVAVVAGRAVQRPRVRSAVSRGLATTIASWFGDRPAIGVGVAAAGGGLDRGARGPARTTLVAAVVATVLITAAAVVHQIEYQVTVDPGLAGYPNDLEVGGGPQPESWSDTMDVLDQSDDVAGLTEARVGVVSVDGRVAQAAGYRAVRGAPQFAVLDGRLPESADEIAVGARSDLQIGSTHELSAATSAKVRVVGRVILDLGDGANNAEVLAPLDALDQLGSERLASTALVQLSDPAKAEAARVELLGNLEGRTSTPFICGTEVQAHYLPDLARPPDGDEPCLPVIGSQLYNTSDVLPLTRAMTGFLAVIGAAVLVQGLVLSGRRRRGEVAVLRSMGFDRRQVVASQVWLGVSVAATAILVGMIIGVAVGRVVGAWISSAIGVVPGPDLPWRTLGLIALGAIVVAVGSAVPIGLSALRRPPAVQLRAE